MSEPLNIVFIDFWEDFDPRDWFIPLFERVLGPNSVQVVPPNHPHDLVIFSVFGLRNREMTLHTARRVFYTGERYGRPEAVCDFAITFDWDECNNHMRCPIWQLDEKDVARAILQDRVRRWNQCSPLLRIDERPEFCTWVASWESQVREQLVGRIAAGVGPIACGGARLNTTGGPVDDKHQFLQTSRFSLALENASQPGYCTEKLLQAFNAGCVPIYWGDPEVTRDFNPDAFINIHDFDSYTDLFQTIKALDGNPHQLRAMSRQPIFSDSARHRLTRGRTKWESKLVQRILGTYPALNTQSA